MRRRSGSACLNSIPRFLSGLRAVHKRCRVNGMDAPFAPVRLLPKSGRAILPAYANGGSYEDHDYRSGPRPRTFSRFTAWMSAGAQATQARPGSVFRALGALPDRNRSLRRRSLLGRQADRARSSSEDNGTAVRQAVCQDQQERLTRCRGNLRGRRASEHAIRADQVARTAGRAVPARPLKVGASIPLLTLRERMHDAIPEQGKWLKAVVMGSPRFQCNK